MQPAGEREVARGVRTHTYTHTHILMSPVWPQPRKVFCFHDLDFCQHCSFIHLHSDLANKSQRGLCLWGGAPLSQLQVALSTFLWPPGPALQVSCGHSPALPGTGLRASQGPLSPFQSPGLSLRPSEPGPVPRSASCLLRVKRSAASSHLPYLSPALPK